MVTLAPNPTIAKIGPIADFSVSNADYVRKSISAHVGQEDGLRRVVENQRRTLFLVDGIPSVFPQAKTALALRRIPRHHLILGNKDVGEPVAVYINEPEIGIAGIQIRKIFERSEALPTRKVGPFIVAAQRTFEPYHILMPVGSQIHELRPCAPVNRPCLGG
jgi:hypothetical protein